MPSSPDSQTTPPFAAEASRSLPELETGRLILRRLDPADARDLFAYASDPEMTHWVSWEPHPSIDESKAVLAQIIAECEQGKRAQWAIVDKRDRKMIGMVGFNRWRQEEQALEIGFSIARRHWGQGLMTEAVRAVLRFGFRELGVDRIVAKHASLNPAAGRVMAKAGMQCEGAKQVGNYRPIHYSITRAQYERSALEP